MEDLLIHVFRAWESDGVRFLVLRNYECLPAATGNDVDVLLDPAELKRAEKTMISAAAACGFLLHNRVEFATLSCFFFHPATLNQVQIDLFTRVSWHSLEMFSAETILAKPVRRSLFSVPAPAAEAAINLLSRLIYHGSVREKYKDQIATAFSSCKEEAVTLLAEPFGKPAAAQLVALCVDRKWAEAEGLSSSLRHKLIVRRFLRKPTETLQLFLLDAARVCRRFLRPGGLFLAVLGADGSGKSTVADRLTVELRNTFQPEKVVNVHWKPVVFFKTERRENARPVVDPHAKPPRGRLASVAYLAFHWTEYVLGSWIPFTAKLFNNSLVLVDRYFYDFFVDQRRYRLQVPEPLLRLLFRFVRKPDLVLLFDAPAEVLQSRKQEVPLEETRRQVAAFRALVSTMPNGCILDASRPIDEVTRAATARILEHLRHRTEKWGGE